MDLGKCEETAYLGGGDFSLGEPEADVSLLNLYVLPKGKIFPAVFLVYTI